MHKNMHCTAYRVTGFCGWWSCVGTHRVESEVKLLFPSVVFGTLGEVVIIHFSLSNSIVLGSIDTNSVVPETKMEYHRNK